MRGTFISQVINSQNEIIDAVVNVLDINIH